MSEQQKILEMIENGQITAAEGMELLEALKTVDKETVVYEISPATKKPYKYLKIKVIAEEDNTKVNVNIPLKLLNAIGELSTQISAFIPEDARQEMVKNGVDLSKIDIQKILEAIASDELDDPSIVDVDVNDPQRGIVQVKIYVE